jgi:DNA-binding LacI/PurR family transcriptional regulator
MTKSEEGANYHFDHVYLSRMHAVMRLASEKGYTTEALCLDEDDDWGRLDRLDGPFADRVQGIICLHSFPAMDAVRLDDDQIPMVFLESPQGQSRPSVYHDGYYAIYQATRMAIEAGHRNILAYCGPPHPDCGLETSLAGHRRAMQEAGLPPCEEAIALSLKHDADDLVGIREYLLRFSDATALISLTSAKARRIVVVCDVLGIRIPEDLSLISQASAPMRADDLTTRISGPKADTSRTVIEAFEILAELIHTRRCARSQVVLKPNLIPGDTLAAPRTGRPTVAAALMASFQGAGKD